MSGSQRFGSGSAAREGLAAIGLAAFAVVCCAGLPVVAELVGGVAVGVLLGVGAGVAALVVAGVGVGSVLWTGARRRRAPCKADITSKAPDMSLELSALARRESNAPNLHDEDAAA